ncbi:MAG: dipeptidase [Anaerolineales bacterium]|nr:dipeptidase [Anaerolineales bacterium]
MPSPKRSSLDYAGAHQERFLNELIEFTAIPSISTSMQHIEAMGTAARWVSQKMKNIGLQQVQVFPTDRHPVVYGEDLRAGPEQPTVLIYGHYDVQPAEPLEEWHSPPFTPTQRDGKLFGRGASDMKGQVAATLNAVEAILANGPLPVNVKFMIEGEEEIGSPSLGKFMRAHKDLLACDFALNPDTGMLPGLPTITYALRGLAYFELRVRGPKQDLHSGLFGGAVHNPGQVICELIAGMHDDQGRITLPGFYDRVIEMDAEERAALAELPVGDDFVLEQTGVPALWGEAGYTSVERLGGRPTLEVNGLYSGFIGEGGKTVLPAYAMAKLSCRLVPAQDPQEVGEQLRQYLREHAPKTVTWELEQMTSGPATLSDRHSEWIQAYLPAAEAAWGVTPVFKREGGSVPVVMDFQEILGVESVNIGFGLPTDNLHGPNEKLEIDNWYKGIEALIHYLYQLERK